MVAISVSSALGLLPLSWIVHDFEGILMRDRWKRKKEVELDEGANQSRLVGRVMKIHSTPAREFGIAVLVVGILLFAVIAVATQNPDGNWAFLYAGFLGCYFLHAFLHVGQSVILRGYTPGVVTAICVVVPMSAFLYSVLFQADILNSRLALLTTLAGIVVFLSVVLGAQRLASLSG